MSGIIVIVGVWVRQLVSLNHWFPWVVIGQFIISFGGPQVTISITTLALNWFGDHEKSTAVALGSTAFPFGALIGFAFPAFFLND